MKRPKTRGDCVGGVRPCPWATCRYNLANEHGNTELEETCALDIVDDYPNGLERTDVCRITGLSEREARDAERSGLVKIRRSLATFATGSPEIRGSLPEIPVREEGGG